MQHLQLSSRIIIFLELISLKALPSSHGWVLSIDRSSTDIIKNFKGCRFHSHKTFNQLDCECDSNFSTVLSIESERYRCLSPCEIGCSLTLIKINHNGFLRVNMSLLHVAIIQRVLIWDSIGRHKSTWYDITELSLKMINLRSNFVPSDLNYDESILRFDTFIWGGHVIKIVFADWSNKKCQILKFEGRIYYPFNINAFRNDIEVLAKLSFKVIPWGLAVNNGTTGDKNTSLVQLKSRQKRHSKTYVNFVMSLFSIPLIVLMFFGVYKVLYANVMVTNFRYFSLRKFVPSALISKSYNVEKHSRQNIVAE